MVLNKKYAGLALLIFFVEVLIAWFVKDSLVRPYVGDVLVVILIYCSAQSFFRFKMLTLAAGVLMFSFMVEFLQYLSIVEKLGWQDSVLARTIIGTSFAWADLVAYLAGIIIVLVVENFRRNKIVVSTYDG